MSSWKVGLSCVILLCITDAAYSGQTNPFLKAPVGGTPPPLQQGKDLPSPQQKTLLPPPPLPSMPPAANHLPIPEPVKQSKWKIVGTIDDKYVLLDPAGTTLLVSLGQTIDDCVVGQREMNCDSKPKPTVKEKPVVAEDKPAVKEEKEIHRLKTILQEKDAALKSAANGLRHYLASLPPGLQESRLSTGWQEAEIKGIGKVSVKDFNGKVLVRVTENSPQKTALGSISEASYPCPGGICYVTTALR